ncbi:MAG TPA: hypothetical protein PKA27_02320 [Fimbriimonadaceae bacterium]|nr:hypothetical protein [Fimbriimonadaceae bacterium]
MDENTIVSPEETTVINPSAAESEYKFADALAETRAESQEPTDDKSEEPSKQPEPEGSKEDQPEEKEKYPLRDSIKEALKDKPELITEWDNQWRGFEKVKAQLETREAQLKTDEDGIKGMKALEAALSDPETAFKALEDLTKKVAEYHQTDYKPPASQKGESAEGELIGPHGVDNETPDLEEWDRLGWESESHYEQAKRIRELESQLSKSKETQKPAEQAARKETLSTDALKAIQAKVSSEFAGLEITHQQISNAIDSNPDLPPLEAVEHAYRKEIIEHLRQVARKESRGPEILDTAKVQGRTRVPTERFHFRDALAEVRNE